MVNSMGYKEIKGNLISLSLNNEFDVIAHGVNCFCTMGAGLAPQMVKNFYVDNYTLEKGQYKGDINKLGCIDYRGFNIIDKVPHLVPRGAKCDLIVVNLYSQYKYGRNHIDGHLLPVDYDAIKLGLRKMNHEFKGKHIGLPLIGCGLAGGSFDIVKDIIQKELKDCNVTVVHYNGK